MNTTPIYRAIRARLAAVQQPIFPFIGQYTKGKDNTAYKAGIYIEIPKNLDVYNYGSVKSARDTIRIHVLSNAPYKNHDNEVQDAAYDTHNAVLKAVEDLLQGWVIKDNLERLLTQQFVGNRDSMHNVLHMQIYSILGFTTEMYDIPTP